MSPLTEMEPDRTAPATDQGARTEDSHKGCCGCVIVLCIAAAALGLWMGSYFPGAR